MLNFLPSSTDGARPLGLGIFPLLWVGVLDIAWEPRNPVRRRDREIILLPVLPVLLLLSRPAWDSACARRLLVTNSGPTAQIY